MKILKCNISAIDSVRLYFIIAVERVYISLSNDIPSDKYSVMISRDRVVIGAREQVINIALCKSLNNNLF